MIMGKEVLLSISYFVTPDFTRAPILNSDWHDAHLCVESAAAQAHS